MKLIQIRNWMAQVTEILSSYQSPVLFTTVLLMSGTSCGLSTDLLDELASTGTINDPPCPHDLTCIYGMGD